MDNTNTIMLSIKRPVVQLTAEQTLFERLQSTKFLLALLIFCVSAVLVFLKSIDPGAFASICTWIIVSYIAGDVGKGMVDMLGQRDLLRTARPVVEEHVG